MIETRSKDCQGMLPAGISDAPQLSVIEPRKIDVLFGVQFCQRIFTQSQFSSNAFRPRFLVPRQLIAFAGRVIRLHLVSYERLICRLAPQMPLRCTAPEYQVCLSILMLTNPS
jgi:hypothetical protein